MVSLTRATCVAHITFRYENILIIILDNRTIKVLSKEAPVSSFYVLPLRSKNSPQYPVQVLIHIVIKK
jgi:hypothetical protein